MAARVLLPIFVLGVPVFACNALTGAGDLEPCTGPNCELDGAQSQIDGASQRDGFFQGGDGGDGFDAPFPLKNDGGKLADGAPFFDAFSDPTPVKDAAVPCSTCDSGTCQESGGGCSIEEDCCSGLQCSAGGRCVTTCGSGSGQGSFCFGGPCCLGFKCSFVLECAACALAGAACNSGSGGGGMGSGGGGNNCCSGVCNANNKCVGNIPTK